MRFAPDGQEYDIQWYFTKPPMTIATYPTTFSSRNWLKQVPDWPEVGEVEGAPRTWVDGAAPSWAGIRTRVGTDLEWAEGFDVDPPPHEMTPSCVPVDLTAPNTPWDPGNPPPLVVGQLPGDVPGCEAFPLLGFYNLNIHYVTNPLPYLEGNHLLQKFLDLNIYFFQAVVLDKPFLILWGYVSPGQWVFQTFWDGAELFAPIYNANIFTCFNGLWVTAQGWGPFDAQPDNSTATNLFITVPP